MNLATIGLLLPAYLNPIWQAESALIQEQPGSPNNNAQAASVPRDAAVGPHEPSIAKGEKVAEIDKSCWIVFQDKSNNHWFGSDGNGVSRYDGKTITRFTTKDGLAHDQVRGIQQHAASGDILITTNGGVSKFDGKRFVTLPIVEMKPPVVVTASSGAAQSGTASAGAASSGGKSSGAQTVTALDSTTLADSGWGLRADDLWLTGSAGPRRYDGKTLHQLKFAKSPLEEEILPRIGKGGNWSPYDVWTVYKDSKGQMWFGTGMFGVCRFDGRSFDWMFEPHLTEVPGAGWFGFRSIIEDRHGDFWVCNTQFRYKMEPHAAADPRDSRLKYTREKGMDLTGSATTDKFLYFQSITEDNQRDLWMTPYGGGVWRYDGKKVTHYPMKVGDEEILMISIYKDNRGDLWVGTQENGAYRFNGKAFERFRP